MYKIFSLNNSGLEINNNIAHTGKMINTMTYKY